MVRRITAVFLFTCCLSSLEAQDFQWVTPIGDTTQCAVNQIIGDAQGNIYAIGEFQGDFDFDPGTGTQVEQSAGLSDAFISKYNANHQFQWVRRIGANSMDRADHLVVDAAGNCFVSGPVSSLMDIDPGSGALWADTDSLDRRFLIQLDPNGNLVWGKTLRGTQTASMTALHRDALGNILFTGIFRGTMDADLGPGVSNLINPTFQTVSYLIKLNPAGNLLWAKSFEDSDISPLNLKTTASGEILLSGEYRDTADLDLGPSVYTVITDPFFYNELVMKLDASGNFLWAKTIGLANNEENLGLRVGDNDTIFLLGKHDNIVDVDPGAGVFNVGNGSPGFHLVKLDPSGNFRWGYAWDLPSSMPAQQGWDVADGKVYLSGRFSNSMDANPGSGTTTLTAVGNSDAYLLRLERDGTLANAEQIGGPTAIVNPYALSCAAGGNLYLGGYFSREVDFDPDANVQQLNSGISTIGFVLHLLDTAVFVGSAPAFAAAASFKLFPNPTAGSFTVDFSKTMYGVDLSVYNLQGICVHRSRAAGMQSVEIDLNLPAATYLVAAKIGDRMEVQRLVIE
jgi:hypothetical protein